MQDDSQNYEDLFNLTSPTGDDPTESSLFNLTTLKDLIKVGSSIVDVVANPETKSADLNLAVL
jgi:hypothetical protein